MSPAPTARARPPPSCARCSRPPARRVHVYTSPHLVRFHERIRLGAPGGGRFVDEDELVDALLHVERINGGRADHPVRDHHRGRVRPLRRHPGRRPPARGRPRRPLDATNVVAEPLAAVDHLDLDRPREIPRRHRRRDRRREGRHHQARPAGDRRAADRRGRSTVIEARGRAAGAPAVRRQPRLGRPSPSTAGWSTRTRTGSSTCRPAPGRPPPVHQCRHGDRRAAPGRPRPADGGDRGGACQRRLAGAPAAADRRRARRSAPAPDAEIWLDGGHNPGAGRRHRRGDGRPRGARAAAALPDRRHAQHQGPGRLLPALRRPGRAASSRCRCPGSDAGRDPGELADGGARAPASPPSRRGCREPRSTASPREPTLAAPPRILICGSLYLAGAVLAENGTPPR